jgi:hypothetical protein
MFVEASILHSLLGVNFFFNVSRETLFRDSLYSAVVVRCEVCISLSGDGYVFNGCVGNWQWSGRAVVCS